MSDRLNTISHDIEAYPYAVASSVPDSEAETFVHFSDKGAADFYAMLLDSPENSVERYVANPDTLEWHKVSAFLL